MSIAIEYGIDETFTYRLMSFTDVVDVSELVARVFSEFIAPEYSPQGVQEFHRYSQPSEFLARQYAHHFALVSVVQDKVVGVIEMRFHKHVFLLFVAPEFQRWGIPNNSLVERYRFINSGNQGYRKLVSIHHRMLCRFTIS